MSRTKTIISILIIIIIALAGIWYWFFFQKGIPLFSTKNNTTKTENGSFSPLNPNNNLPNTNETSTTTKDQPSSNTPNQNLPDEKTKVVLKKIYSTPVSFGIIGSSTANSSSVIFVDRGNGHIFQSFIEGTTTKISDTTILRVYESFFDTKGKNVILRYLKEGSDEITSLFAPVAPEIKAKNVSKNILNLAVSPKGDRIFTLEKSSVGVIGFVSKIDGSNKTQVFDSPLTGWVVSWPEENTVALNTKASNISSGYLYFVDIKKNIVKKILGPINGLTSNTSHDLKKIIYSSSNISKTNTSLFTLGDKTSQDTLFLTLPEKCVWSNIKKNGIYCAVPTEVKGSLPDDWYKGQIKNTDQIWYLNTTTNDIHKVSNLFEASGEYIDAINLVLDPKEQALFFINKSDLSLWSIDLTE